MKLSISPFVFLIGICICIDIGYVTASSGSEKRESDASKQKRELNLRAHLQVDHVDGLTLPDDLPPVDDLMQAFKHTPQSRTSSTCHSDSAIRNNDLSIAGMICDETNQRFLGNLCNMIKTSPPIYKLLNDTFNATDLEELDKIPGFNLTAFETLVEQLKSEEGVPQFTVYAPDNAALREFARQSLDYLIDLQDPQIMLFIEESGLKVNSNQMIDTFFLSPQGRLCRDTVALNHIAIGGSSYDDLDCGETTYMLGGDATTTDCDDLSYYRRNLQNNLQSNLHVGTSKSQFGRGNFKNNLDVNKEFTQPRIIDSDYLVSNGFVHVVNAVCLPIVENEIVYKTIAAIEYVPDTDFVSVFETCDCPLCHDSSSIPNITPLAGRTPATKSPTSAPSDQPSSDLCEWSESEVEDWARDVFGSGNCTELSDSVRCLWNNYEYYGRSLHQAGGDLEYHRDLQFRLDTEIRYGFFFDVSSEKVELFVAGRSYGDGLFPVLDAMIGDNTLYANSWGDCFGDSIVDVLDEIQRFIANPVAVPPEVPAAIHLSFGVCVPDCEDIIPSDPTFLNAIADLVCPKLVDLSTINVTVESFGGCSPCGDTSDEGTDLGLLAVSDDPNFTEEAATEALAENADDLADAFNILFRGTGTLAPTDSSSTESPKESPTFSGRTAPIRLSTKSKRPSLSTKSESLFKKSELPSLSTKSESLSTKSELPSLSTKSESLSAKSERTSYPARTQRTSHSTKSERSISTKSEQTSLYTKSLETKASF